MGRKKFPTAFSKIFSVKQFRLIFHEKLQIIILDHKEHFFYALWGDITKIYVDIRKNYKR